MFVNFETIVRSPLLGEDEEHLSGDTGEMASQMRKIKDKNNNTFVDNFLSYKLNFVPKSKM